MLSSVQLFSFLSIILVVLAVHLTNGAPANSDASDEINLQIDEQNKLFDDQSRLLKRKLPHEGILIGRRAFPDEGVYLGKREYFPEGILLGKREYPHDGILLGKRNFRFSRPKSMDHNRYEN